MKTAFKILEKYCDTYHEDDSKIQFLSGNRIWTVFYLKSFLDTKDILELDRIKKGMDKELFPDGAVFEKLLKKLDEETKYYECKVDVKLLKRTLEFLSKITYNACITFVLNRDGALYVVYTDGHEDIVKLRVGETLEHHKVPEERIKIGCSIDEMLRILKVMGDYDLTFSIPEKLSPIMGMNGHRGFAIAPRVEEWGVMSCDNISRPERCVWNI
ncbi:MAG: hypothetical protein DRN30_04595 [Thermoplasmata archaeon]|nr:MAG: hypothetical protein DRN30_04595 [Thermoplasmata archaeon]